jgi:hypothetical protein
MTNTITDKRERGYFQIDNEIVENYQLSPYSGWLYCVISKYANRATGESFPSLNTLAQEANMSKPAVIKHMAELEKRNLITVKREKINAKKNAVNRYFLQPIIKNSYLELLKVVNEVNHLVNEVDRNKTQVNKTKEKDSSAPQASAESLGDSSDTPQDDGKCKTHAYVDRVCIDCGEQLPDDCCETCGHVYRWLFDEAGNKHHVCNCTTGEDMRKSGFVGRLGGGHDKADTCPDCNEVRHDGTCLCDDTPLMTGDGLAPQRKFVKHEGGITWDTVDPFEDKNDPNAPEPTPLHEKPKPVGTRFSFGANGIERQPLTPENSQPKRIVTKEGEPIAQIKPADIKAETVETKTVVQEAAPEKKPAKKKAKAKPKHSKEQRDAMKAAVLKAFHREAKDVMSWALMNKVITKHLDKGHAPDLIIEWGKWNDNLECGKSSSIGALLGDAWGRFMSDKRERDALPSIADMHNCDDELPPLDPEAGIAYIVGDES